MTAQAVTRTRHVGFRSSIRIYEGAVAHVGMSVVRPLWRLCKSSAITKSFQVLLTHIVANVDAQFLSRYHANLLVGATLWSRPTVLWRNDAHVPHIPVVHTQPSPFLHALNPLNESQRLMHKRDNENQHPSTVALSVNLFYTKADVFLCLFP